MLSYIEEYLRQLISEERVQLFLDVLRVMYNYQIASPAQSIVDLISIEDAYPASTELLMVEMILNDAVNSVLNSFQIITHTTIEQNLELLKALHLLEGFFDSEVIVTLHDEALDAKEMLLVYLPLVTNKPVEYFDEFIIDVRPSMIERLYEHHLENTEGDIEDNPSTISKEKIEKIKAFGDKYPESLGISLVTTGIIKVNSSVSIVMNFLQDKLDDVSDVKTIALEIYSIALICNESEGSVVKNALDLVNRLYDDIHLTSSIKNAINSLELGK